MCSRFELSARPRDLAHRFDAEIPDGGFVTGEIRPTNVILMLGPNGAAPMPWGLKVDWDRKPLINARAETLTEKRTFQPLLENRCLVPASAYFEWRKDGGQRLKNRIAVTEAPLFAFAGLTDGERVTVVTRVPKSEIAHIHNRMPVILPAEAEARWIDPALPFAAVQPLLGTADDPPMTYAEDAPPPPRQGDLFAT